MSAPEKRGDAIHGSRLFRDWCAGCREPIRVTAAALELARNWCRDCAPSAPVADPPPRRGRAGEAADREFHGGRFNAGEW